MKKTDKRSLSVFFIPSGEVFQSAALLPRTAGFCGMVSMSPQPNSGYLSLIPSGEVKEKLDGRLGMSFYAPA